MIRPPYLKKGDKVAIIAPARKVTMSDITKGVEIIQSWGLKAIFSTNIFEENNQFAGSDKMRTEDLQKAINNQEIKAIFCSRGGYGTVRIIDKIDFSPLTSNPKWIIGFSDITVIHNKLNNIGIESLHAHLLTTMDTATNDSIEAMKKILFGETEINTAMDNSKLTSDNIARGKNIPVFHSQSKQNQISNRSGHTKGELIGGNLSILYSMMGSDCELDTDDKILFIEDLDEYLYHIDRMMMCLKRAGKLSSLKGLIVGDVSQMNDNTIPFGKTAEQIIMDAVSEYDYPVCFNMPFGHINNNMPLILGSTIELNVNKNDVNIHFIDSEEKIDKKSQTKRMLYTALWLLGFFLLIWIFCFIFGKINL